MTQVFSGALPQVLEQINKNDVGDWPTQKEIETGFAMAFNGNDSIETKGVFTIELYCGELGYKYRYFASDL